MRLVAKKKELAPMLFLFPALPDKRTTSGRVILTRADS